MTLELIKKSEYHRKPVFLKRIISKRISMKVKTQSVVRDLHTTFTKRILP